MGGRLPLAGGAPSPPPDPRAPLPCTRAGRSGRGGLNWPAGQAASELAALLRRYSFFARAGAATDEERLSRLAMWLLGGGAPPVGAVCALAAGQDGAAWLRRVLRPPAPPPSRTKWTRRVPRPVLIGHAASLSQVAEWGCAHLVRRVKHDDGAARGAHVRDALPLLLRRVHPGRVVRHRVQHKNLRTNPRPRRGSVHGPRLLHPFLCRCASPLTETHRAVQDGARLRTARRGRCAPPLRN